MSAWLAVKVRCGIISRFLHKSCQMEDRNSLGYLPLRLTVVGEHEKIKKGFAFDQPTHISF